MNYNLGMDEEELVLLINKLLKYKRETTWIEFKKNYTGPTELGMYISGLANAALLAGKEKAYLVYGIEDTTLEVVGTTFDFDSEKEKQQELTSWITTKINPQTVFSNYKITFMGKDIVILEIESAKDRPIKFQNNAYIRIGTYLKPLEKYPDIERKIWLSKPNARWETNRTIPKCEISDIQKLLNIDAYFKLLNKPKPVEELNIINELLQDELIIKDTNTYYSITNLGGILLANDLAEFPSLKRKSVRVIFYKGIDRLNAKSEIVGGKGYAVGFESLVNYINDKLPSEERIQSALREEYKIYPYSALREFIANALIHQDFYEDGAGPMIEIFENRVEITNPGIPLIEVTRFIDHTPKSRNEKLASMMKIFHICEERGHGIDKAINSVELHQLPAPKFDTYETATKVTLFAPKRLIDMSREDKIRACYQHCCLMHVSNSKMTNTTLRKRLNIEDKNYATASRIIADTLKEKQIKKGSELNSYIPWWA